jgi:hypothetical protein
MPKSNREEFSTPLEQESSSVESIMNGKTVAMSKAIRAGANGERGGGNSVSTKYLQFII